LLGSDCPGPFTVSTAWDELAFQKPDRYRIAEQYPAPQLVYGDTNDTVIITSHSELSTTIEKMKIMAPAAL